MVVGFWLTVFAVVLGVPLIMALALARRGEGTAAVAVHNHSFIFNTHGHRHCTTHYINPTDHSPRTHMVGRI